MFGCVVFLIFLSESGYPGFKDVQDVIGNLFVKI